MSMLLPKWYFFVHLSLTFGHAGMASFRGQSKLSFSVFPPQKSFTQKMLIKSLSLSLSENETCFLPLPPFPHWTPLCSWWIGLSCKNLYLNNHVGSVPLGHRIQLDQLFSSIVQYTMLVISMLCVRRWTRLMLNGGLLFWWSFWFMLGWSLIQILQNHTWKILRILDSFVSIQTWLQTSVL